MSKKQRKTQYLDEERRLWGGGVLVLLTESSFIREKELQREALERRSEREILLKKEMKMLQWFFTSKEPL